MKKLSLVIMCMTIAGASIANTHNESGVTNCYVLKNNKLITKGICRFNETIGTATDDSYAFYTGTFKMKSMGEINIHYDYLSQKVTLNNEKALHQYRNARNFNKISSDAAQKYKHYKRKVLNCYKSLETPLEMCAPTVPFL